MTRISVFAAALTFALLATVTVLTLGPPVESVGSTISNDKIQHALGFGSIVLPAAFLRPRWLWWLVPAVAVFGGVIELLQMKVGRDAELLDWAADIVGVAIASALGLLLAGALLRQRTAPVRSTEQPGKGTKARS